MSEISNKHTHMYTVKEANSGITEPLYMKGEKMKKSAQMEECSREKRWEKGRE